MNIARKVFAAASQTAAVIVFSAFLILSAHAADFTVTKTANTNDGVCDADCSLREAVAAANNAPTDDVILFSSLFNTAQTISLGGGELTLAGNGSLTISGTGSNLLTISGGFGERAFFIAAGANAALSGLKIINVSNSANGAVIRNAGSATLNDVWINGNSASAVVNDGGVLLVSNSLINSNVAPNGAGIRNISGGTASVSGSTVKDNLANDAASGGGIYNNGNLTVISSTVSTNRGGRGAGILSDGGTVTLSGVSVSGNGLADSGGGIHVQSGLLIVNNSTFSANKAWHGGALSSAAGTTVNITNSTIAANQATGSPGNGGGGYFSGTVHLLNVTVGGNTASAGGGIYNNGGTVNARNTLIGDNGVQDFQGVLSSQGFNLIETTIGTTITGVTSGNILGVDAELMPLGNYGGATQTLALHPTSPAIDAADPNNFPATDQRGFARPADGNLDHAALPDIGTYERTVNVLTVTKTADTNDGTCDSDCSLREAFAAAAASVLTDSAIVFDQNVFSAPRTITLTGGELIGVINRTLAVYGTGANLLTISGNNQSRIFAVYSSMLLSGMTLTHGNGAGASNSGTGGAVYNGAGALAIFDSVITDNTAMFAGGIKTGENFYGGRFQLINSVVSNKHATRDAGG
jgi:CSLREA domain-containing protein